MNPKHRELLDKMYWFFENYKEIDDEVLHEKCVDNFLNPMEELIPSKDAEVLKCLLDFFEHDFDYDLEGIYESLKARIGANFTLDQLIEAFNKNLIRLQKMI